MGLVNCKNAAQFPFMQPKNTSLVPNTTPFIDFGLNLLATGRVEQTIRISVVMSPVNFSFFNRVQRGHFRGPITLESGLLYLWTKSVVFCGEMSGLQFNLWSFKF